MLGKNPEIFMLAALVSGHKKLMVRFKISDCADITNMAVCIVLRFQGQRDVQIYNY